MRWIASIIFEKSILSVSKIYFTPPIKEFHIAVLITSNYAAFLDLDMTYYVLADSDLRTLSWAARS